MAIKIDQHNWGERHPFTGAATCQKCGVFCPCERVALDVDMFFIIDGCIVHKGINDTRKCPPQLDLAI